MKGCLGSNKTADGIVHTGSCEFYGAIAWGNDADCTVKIYDSTAASGTIIMALGAAAERGGAEGLLSYPVGCINGIYVDITTTGGSVTVYYRPNP